MSDKVCVVRKEPSRGGFFFSFKSPYGEQIVFPTFQLEDEEFEFFMNRTAQVCVELEKIGWEVIWERNWINILTDMWIKENPLKRKRLN